MSARLHQPEEISADAAYVLERTPPSVWAKLAKYMREQEGREGIGRVIELHVALHPKTGKPTAKGTFVDPPRDWAEERERESP